MAHNIQGQKLRQVLLFFSGLVFSLALAACGGKVSGGKSGEPIYTGPPCQDALTLPQDLNVYATAAGGVAPLITRMEQEAAAERQKSVLFKPWSQTKPSRFALRAGDCSMKPGQAFTEGNRPFPPNVWQSIAANCNRGSAGKESGPGITLRHTSLRAMPTSMPHYIKPELPGEGYPFDYFQYTTIPLGTPVYICGVSRDGLWLLVESPISAGWILAKDVAGVDADFIGAWQGRPLAALVRDKVNIGEEVGHIGTLLPFAGGQPNAVLMPRRGGSGRAEVAFVNLLPGSVTAVPMTLSPANVASVGNQMMGQTYGWGGMDEKRDCSSLMRDLMTPFGLFLPRNSASQARVGLPVDVAGLVGDEKEAVIIRQAVPFRSMIWMPGHIGLYVGVYNGKAVFYHNMWGLRTKDAAGGCDGRAVVGKAVVTTLRPGIERPDLCHPGSFLDRIERAVVLPGI